MAIPIFHASPELPQDDFHCCAEERLDLATIFCNCVPCVQPSWYPNLIRTIQKKYHRLRLSFFCNSSVCFLNQVQSIRGYHAIMNVKRSVSCNWREELCDWPNLNSALFWISIWQSRVNETLQITLLKRNVFDNCNFLVIFCFYVLHYIDQQIPNQFHWFTHQTLKVSRAGTKLCKCLPVGRIFSSVLFRKIQRLRFDHWKGFTSQFCALKHVRCPKKNWHPGKKSFVEFLWSWGHE